MLNRIKHYSMFLVFLAAGVGYIAYVIARSTWEVWNEEEVDVR